MRWPFGPPHLTLKPSPKNTETKKQTKKPKKQKQKKRKKESPNKKQQKHQKIAFQLSVKFFLFFGWLFKIPFFDTLAQKARTQKTL